MNIYLFNVEGTEIYKIGFTKGDPKKRLKNLQTGNPFKLVVTEVYQSKYGRKLEKILHRTFEANKIYDFNDLHLKGEWFQLSLKEVFSFKEQCKKIEKNISIIKKDTTLDNF